MGIRDIVARPGEKVHGFIDIAGGPVERIRMPLAVARGRTEGPTLLITAGVHPSEYPGMEAASRTLRDLDPVSLCGTMIIVPVVNLIGLEAGVSNTCPVDNLNLNRIFPGSAEGTLGQRIAWTLCQEVLSKADFLVDLHGGDLSESLDPFVIFNVSGQADVDATSERMARACQTKSIWKMVTNAYEGTLVGYAAGQGKSGIVLEAGQLGTYREGDIQVHLRGIRNIMRLLGMREDDMETVENLNQHVYTGWFSITAQEGGFFHPMVFPGDHVSRGQVVGHIKDIWGSILEELVSPEDGVVRIWFPKRTVFSGAPVFRCWTV